MPFIQLSTVRLHYYESGHGPNTLLFVHGFQASGRIWQLVRERLPEDEYRCIAVENRGAGQSDAPESEYDYGCKPFADDLYEVITGLGLRDVVLVGHSMGGATAMQFAVDHPEVLRALVLLDPAGPDGIDAGVTDIDAAVEQRMVQRRQGPQGSAALAMQEDSGGMPPEFAAALAADIAAAPEQRLRGSYRSMLTLRLGDAVARLPMPVLLIGGDADQLVPLPRMLETYAKLPAGSGLHIWHGVGHSPNIEVPDRFTRVLRRFVERTVPARLRAEPVASQTAH